jgi:hypothetical protein
MSSSQLTKSYFSEGYTTNQIFYFYIYIYTYIYIYIIYA